MLCILIAAIISGAAALSVSRATFSGVPLLEPNQPPIMGQVTFVQGLPNDARTLVTCSIVSGLVDQPIFAGQTGFFMQVVNGRVRNGACPLRDDVYSFLGTHRRLDALPSGATAPEQFYVDDVQVSDTSDKAVVIVRSRGGAGAIVACANIDLVF